MNIGDVNWVEFPPRNGHVQTGRRPAIIAQDALLLNGQSPDSARTGVDAVLDLRRSAIRLKWSSVSPRFASTGHDYHRS